MTWTAIAASGQLDEVDKALERRGHCFVRYADAANVDVRSRRAGERVMALLRRLYGKLRLTVNETKSAVASVFGRKFLGYSFWVAPGQRDQAQGRRQTAEDVQATHPATDQPQWRAQPAGCGGSSTWETAPAPVGTVLQTIIRGKWRIR